jgi:hypothetical protein
MSLFRKTLLLEGLLLASLVVEVGLQQRQISQLRARILAQQELLAAQREAPPVIPTPAVERSENREMEELGNENRDLLRLRNEVGLLRTRQHDFEGLRDENARLKTLINNMEHGVIWPAFQFAPNTGPPPSAWIGINIMAQKGSGDLTRGTDRVVIGSVAANSPAAEAQLEEGDIVLRADGEAITNLVQFRDWVINGTPGQPLVLDVLRENTEHQVTVIRKSPP